MPVSHVDVLVLGLLAEEPLYGYQLLERYRARAMEFWAPAGRASVYQSLRRLEREGMVSGKSQEGREGPDRRVYRVSRPGRDRLRQALLEWFGPGGAHPADRALPFGFAHLLPAEEVRRGIAARDASLRQRVQDIGAERSRLQAARGPTGVLARRMLDREEALAGAELAWLGAFRRDAGRIRRAAQ
ncbi:MAG: PadR family transcriptional regulator [Actinomycetota bacterium]|nr:PadR family transcriptional regulator [Actinomycetota bacterium]